MHGYLIIICLHHCLCYIEHKPIWNRMGAIDFFHYKSEEVNYVIISTEFFPSLLFLFGDTKVKEDEKRDMFM